MNMIFTNKPTRFFTQAAPVPEIPIAPVLKTRDLLNEDVINTNEKKNPVSVLYFGNFITRVNSMNGECSSCSGYK